jgi:hypothetical protein
VPGLLRASAINSLTVLAGSDGSTAITAGTTVMMVIGVKSRSGSYGIFLFDFHYTPTSHHKEKAGDYPRYCAAAIHILLFLTRAVRTR